MWRGSYGRWLNWCASNGRLEAADLAARVTHEAVKAYVTDLRTQIASRTISGYISGLYTASEVMAPTRDWRWLRKKANRLHKLARPSRNKRERRRALVGSVRAGRGTDGASRHRPGRNGRRFGVPLPGRAVDLPHGGAATPVQ